CAAFTNVCSVFWRWRASRSILASEHFLSSDSSQTFMNVDAAVVVVGAGLAGLVAATELADAGRRVIVVEQEPEQSLGGQAFWSLGGLFLVNSPAQRRLRIRDSYH